ncbi:pectate lyase family protein [Actinomadura mexicana]|uniref:pectate lyase family protein n=1 Tax=Actinomadura mexicana TaxID=134959 RepID=UPI001FE2897E|nr:right-handed parallel beta-helix repeat-containing protein [Actinomadura mexicana]
MADLDGDGLGTTRTGHGDAQHLGDFDPARPGLEYVKVSESSGRPSSLYIDPRDGRVLWSTSRRTRAFPRGRHVHPTPAADLRAVTKEEPRMKTRTLLLGTFAVTAGVAVTVASGASGAAVPPADSLQPGAAVAAESSPVGYASMNGGTTGGAGGATVTATSASQLNTYATASAPYIIRITGSIAVSGMQKVASNKTVIGVGTSGRITGGGLNVSQARNVIIRNLTFTGASDDAINVQYSTNVWIDHNDLSKGYDGLTDVKRASDFITVSWNHYHDHDKTALLGHSDDNAGEDLGHLRVTYVHNWFDGTNQRHPRVRFANPVHVLNNYYSGIGSYGVASTENAGVYVERNYFENVARPTSLQEGSSDQGNIKVLNNYLVNSGTPVTRNSGSVAAIPYSYTPEANSTVKATVTAGAGVGHV